ncbi:hypothetical protein SEVIR_6G202150v4 [Setaria viridis]
MKRGAVPRAAQEVAWRQPRPREMMARLPCEPTRTDKFRTRQQVLICKLPVEESSATLAIAYVPFGRLPEQTSGRPTVIHAVLYPPALPPLQPQARASHTAAWLPSARSSYMSPAGWGPEPASTVPLAASGQQIPTPSSRL